MPYSEEGDKILVTGVNENCSFLQGIDGFSTFRFDGLTIYYTDSRRIEVRGTLAIKNPEKEKIIFGPNAPLNTFLIFGVFSLGVKSESNGKIKYTEGTGIRIERADSDPWLTSNGGGFVVCDGGTFNAYGGKIQSGLPSGFGQIGNNGKVNGNIEKLTFENLKTPSPIQFRLDLSDDSVDSISIKGLILKGGVPLLFANIKPTIFEVEFEDGYIQSFSNPKRDITLKNFKFGDNFHSPDFKSNTAFDFRDKGGYKFINLDVGTGMTVEESSVNKYQDIGFIKEVNVNISTDTEQPIEGAKIFIKNSKGDIYSSRTNSNGKLDTNLSVLIGEVNVDNSVVKYKYYSKNNNNTDKFDAHCLSYNHQYKAVEKTLKGNGVLEIEERLYEDPFITQKNATIVGKYTGFAIDHTTKTIQTTSDYVPDDLRDWLKLDYVNRDSAEDFFVTGKGEELNIRPYNLNVLAGTLSLGKKFTKIRTTGTITAQNTGNILVPYVDSTQDTVVQFTGADSWKVYSDEAKTNKIAEGTGSWGFIYPKQKTTYYVTINISGEQFGKSFEIERTGTHVVELSMNLTMQKIESAISNLASKVEKDLPTIKDLSKITAENTSKIDIRLSNE